MCAGNEMFEGFSMLGIWSRKGMKIMQILRFWYTFLVQLEMEIM